VANQEALILLLMTRNAAELLAPYGNSLVHSGKINSFTGAFTEKAAPQLSIYFAVGSLNEKLERVKHSER
jgi:hypothetical protein